MKNKKIRKSTRFIIDTMLVVAFLSLLALPISFLGMSSVKTSTDLAQSNDTYVLGTSSTNGLPVKKENVEYAPYCIDPHDGSLIPAKEYK